MSGQPIPPEALVTACVPGCPARVSWEYDPGYAGSYWQPPEPDGFSPTEASCSVDHLDRLANELYDGLLPELDRLAHQWDQLTEAARRLAQQSQADLGARVLRPSLSGLRPVPTRRAIPPPPCSDLPY